MLLKRSLRDETLKNRCRVVFKLVHSRSMWLTVSGRLQNWHVGRSSPVSRCKCVDQSPSVNLYVVLLWLHSRYPDSPPDSSSEPYSPPNGSTTSSLDPRNTAVGKSRASLLTYYFRRRLKLRIGLSSAVGIQKVGNRWHPLRSLKILADMSVRKQILALILTVTRPRP